MATIEILQIGPIFVDRKGGFIDIERDDENPCHFRSWSEVVATFGGIGLSLESGVKAAREELASANQHLRTWSSWMPRVGSKPTTQQKGMSDRLIQGWKGEIIDENGGQVVVGSVILKREGDDNWNIEFSDDRKTLSLSLEEALIVACRVLADPLTKRFASAQYSPFLVELLPEGIISVQAKSSDSSFEEDKTSDATGPQVESKPDLEKAVTRLKEGLEGVMSEHGF